MACLELEPGAAELNLQANPNIFIISWNESQIAWMSRDNNKHFAATFFKIMAIPGLFFFI